MLLSLKLHKPFLTNCHTYTIIIKIICCTKQWFFFEIPSKLSILIVSYLLQSPLRSPPSNFHLRTSPALDENRSTINRCSGFKKRELFSDAHLKAHHPSSTPLSRFLNFLSLFVFWQKRKSFVLNDCNQPE